jgi:protein-disulfide isomerase-like protein with CxxC motif
MSKTLITVDNLQDYVHDNCLHMDANKILTAGARDELTRRGVHVVYDAEPAPCACLAGEAAVATDTDLLVGVAAIIRHHYA